MGANIDQMIREGRPDKEILAEIMKTRGGDERRARFTLAIARGDIPGDVRLADKDGNLLPDNPLEPFDVEGYFKPRPK